MSMMLLIGKDTTIVVKLTVHKDMSILQRIPIQEMGTDNVEYVKLSITNTLR